MERLHRPLRQVDRDPQHRAQAGYAIVGLLTLLPLLMACALALAGTYDVLRRKSLAQSLCVQTVVRLQADLARHLKSLLQLNAQAARLQRQRERAERDVNLARRIGQPEAIAVAEARRIAVITAQLALRARQEQLLNEARLARINAGQELKASLVRLRSSAFRSLTYDVSPLAVEPRPADALAPEYVPREPYVHHERHEFTFVVPLRPAFLPASWRLDDHEQTSACVASLKQEGERWQVVLLAANAPLNSR